MVLLLKTFERNYLLIMLREGQVYIVYIYIVLGIQEHTKRRFVII